MTAINGSQRPKKLRISARKIILATLAFCFTFLITVHLQLKSSVLENKRRPKEQVSLDVSPSKQQLIQTIPTALDNSKSAFHFIVSSDCTSYQRWEVLTQLHSAESAKQCGRFTWIVSGCLEEGSEHIGKGKGGAKSDILTPTLLLEEVERHFPHFTMSANANTARDQNDCTAIHPHIHFTPDFSDMRAYGGPFADGKKKREYINKQGKHLSGGYGNTYKFNNKPNGLYNWIVDFLKNDDRRDETIILIDPDFLFLTKFDFPDGFRVFPGAPAAAKYGLGAQFLDFDLEQICHRAPLLSNLDKQENQTCPFQSLTSSDVHKYYNVGPPYAIHVQDVLAFSHRWKSLVPPIYDQYPLLYAEMFAYVMAAADLNLRHSLVKGLFTGCMTGSPKVDSESKEALKRSAETYAELIEANPLGQDATGGGAASCFMPPLTPPPLLHYCAHYSFETPYRGGEKKSLGTTVTYHFFAKRRVDHDIFNCNITGNDPFEPFFSPTPRKHELSSDWDVLAVCAVVRAINFAKERGCKLSDAIQIDKLREKIKSEKDAAERAEKLLSLAKEKNSKKKVLESLEEIISSKERRAKSLELLLKHQVEASKGLS